MNNLQINQTVQTPNGPALFQHEWYNPDDREGHYAMVRHMRGQEIDLTLCAHQFSATARNGWLVAYRLDEVQYGG